MFTAKIGLSNPHNPSANRLVNAAPWAVHNFGSASLSTSDFYSMVSGLLISESAVWDIRVKVKVNVDTHIWVIVVEVDDNSEVKVNSNIKGDTTKTKSNTGPYPTMVIVSRRGVTKHMVKVV